MKIRKTAFPEKSILFNMKYDYMDSFKGIIHDNEDVISSSDIGKAFFTSSPKWVEKLLRIRNKMMAIFGLKTARKNNREELLKNFTYEPNERIGLFKVFNKTDNEVVLGENDKHLDFRISLLKNPIEGTVKKEIIITTTVTFNNWFGKLYFFPVQPFHKLIVPVMLKATIKELCNKTIKK